MPTFHSIQLHPELRKRLKTRSLHNNNNEELLLLTLTPLALLVRPNLYLDDEQLQEHDARKLKTQVAHALLPTTTTTTPYPGFQCMKNLVISNHSTASYYSTQCASLDALLGTTGIISKGTITQFTGAAGTGKTRLVLQLLHSDAPALILTTKASLPKLLTPQTNQQQQQFVHVSNDYQVLEALGSVTNDIELVILDSASGCLSECVEMVAHELKRLARIQQKAVVVTNGIVRVGMPSVDKPALGSLWERVPDVHVWMEKRDDMPNVVECRLLKHSGLEAESKEPCQLELVESGIRDWVGSVNDKGEYDN